MSYAGFISSGSGATVQPFSPKQSRTFGDPGAGADGKAQISIGGSTAESHDYFSDPAQAARLSSLMEGLIGGAGADYLEFIRNPTASPYFQNAYEGILAALQPQEAASRQALTDRFRAAGGGAGMGGGAHQVAAGQMEADINRNQMAGLTQLLTTLFPQVTNALFAPISETDAILNAMKLEESKQGSMNFSGDVSGMGLTDPYGTPKHKANQLGRNLERVMNPMLGGNNFGGILENIF